MLTQRLRHRIDIQRQYQSQDSTSGDVEISWEDVYASVPCEVLTGSGRESIDAATKTASTDARILMRWLPNIDESMRVVWEGQAFDISAIAYDRTATRDIRLMCVKGKTDGR